MKADIRVLPGNDRSGTGQIVERYRFTRADIAHYITIVAMFGLQYYVAKNPKLMELMHELFPDMPEWNIKPESVKKRKRKK